MLTTPVQDLNPCRIVVVEDDEGMRDLIASVLKSRGHEVTSAGAGEAAVSLTQRGRFHLAIVDFALPGMNGIDTMEALKAMYKAGNL